MKTSSLLLAIGFALTFWLICPFIVIQLNTYFHLPVYTSWWGKSIGVFLFLVGLALFIYCTKLFVHFGKGTPVPIQPPKHFVAHGLYKYSRNPIYLGYFSMFLGYFFFFGHLLLFGYVWTAAITLHLWLICSEEPGLRKRFGKEYLQYQQQVPRWLPKIKF